MNDSGSTQFPTPPKFPGQKDYPAPRPNARVTELPERLENLRRPVSVRGEVVQTKRDGTIRVRTEQGDIELKIRDKAPPSRGQRVEIELSAGNPPRAARVTPQPERTEGQRPTSTTATNAQAPKQSTEQRVELKETPPAPRTSETPVNVEIRPPSLSTQADIQNVQIQAISKAAPQPEMVRVSSPQTQSIAVNTPPPPILTTGQNIRLKSLPAQEALKLIAPSPQETIITRAPITDLRTTLNIPTNTSVSGGLSTALSTEASGEAIKTTFPLTAPLPLILENLGSPVITQAQAFPSPTEAIATTISINTNINTGARITTEIGAIKNISANNIIAQPPPPPSSAISTAAPAPLVQFLTLSSGESISAKITQIQEPEVKIGGKTTINEVNPFNLKNSSRNITNNSKAGEISTSISGFTANKLPILQINSSQTGAPNVLILHAPSENLAQGTQITLLPSATTIATTTSASASSLSFSPHQKAQSTTLLPAFPPSLITTGQWPLFEEIEQSLSRIASQNIQTSAAFLGAAPSPAKIVQMAPAILFFMAAIKSGDITQWLGDKAIETLQKAGQGKLLSRLGEEGQTLGRLGREALPQDWRAMALPMFWEGEVQKIALYYKHDRQGENQENNENQSTRFVFDLALDHMGKVQIDGLFQNKRLDLILRTQQHFSEAMRMEMRQIYAQALGETQITGELSFQNKPEQWVTIQAQNRGIGVEA